MINEKVKNVENNLFFSVIQIHTFDADCLASADFLVRNHKPVDMAAALLLCL